MGIAAASTAAGSLWSKLRVCVVTGWALARVDTLTCDAASALVSACAAADSGDEQQAEQADADLHRRLCSGAAAALLPAHQVTKLEGDPPNLLIYSSKCGQVFPAQEGSAVQCIAAWHHLQCCSQCMFGAVLL